MIFRFPSCDFVSFFNVFDGLRAEFLFKEFLIKE